MSDSRDVIVECAARLLRSEGVDALTTRRVASEAGVQAPKIYRLFGDKEGLVDAVAEYAMATYVKNKASTLDDELEPIEGLKAGWRTHIEFGLANPELYALLSAPGRRRSPATEAGIEVLRRRIGRVAATGLLRVDEERALLMVHAAGTGAVLALLELPAAERGPWLPDAMLDAVLDAIVVQEEPASPTDDLAAPVIQMRALLPDMLAISEAERALMGEWLDRSIDARSTPPEITEVRPV